LHSTSNYTQDRYNSLKDVEGRIFRVYRDSFGIPTIGVGINLNTSSTNLNAVLAQLGFDINGTLLTGAAWIAEQKYMEQIREAAKVKYATNTAVQAALDGILKERARDSSYDTSFIRRTIFKFNNETESKNAFDAIIGSYESRVDSRLGYSKERIALVSLAYNSKTGATDLLGGKLMAAINNDNRAEAWYEIRYNSNLNKIHANRRYQEADLFGLYDSGTLTPDQQTAQAKEIMRMFTRYEVENLSGTKLTEYEQTYPPPGDIDYIVKSIEPASDLLVTNFAMGNTIDGWVIVGKGLDSYNYIDKGNWADNLGGSDSQNDLMFGEKGNDKLYGYGGNDVIYGGEGNDILIGGVGNDTLMGGENDDTYIINAGDGNDTIEDKQGKNKVMFCGEEINFFYQDGDGYVSISGNLTASIVDGHFDVTDGNGTTVRLNEEFQWGDFGTTLIDLPDDNVLCYTSPIRLCEGKQFHEIAASSRQSGTPRNDCFSNIV
jgi:GH24 family phage-related lysozyme (muramidase)